MKNHTSVHCQAIKAFITVMEGNKLFLMDFKVSILNKKWEFHEGIKGGNIRKMESYTHTGCVLKIHFHHRNSNFTFIHYLPIKLWNLELLREICMSRFLNETTASTAAEAPTVARFSDRTVSFYIQCCYCGYCAGFSRVVCSCATL